MIHLVVALAAEARPIARHLGLRGSDETAPFRLYRSESIRLVVTGVGRNACAAGAAYAFAKAGEVRDAAWINVGVAGHVTAEIGSAFVAAKIRDGGDGRSWYPSLLFETGLPAAEVLTVDRPETGYPEPVLYDMEAAAFCSAAARFSTFELVQVLKVVSDNREQPAGSATRGRVTGLIEANLDALDRVLDASAAAAARVTSVGGAIEVDPWLADRHFTVTQERRLRELLERLAALGVAVGPAAVPPKARAATVLAELENRIDSARVGY